MQRQSIGNKVLDFFKSKSLLSVLIGMNVAVWLFMLLFSLVDYLYANPGGHTTSRWLELFALSSSAPALLRRPWTLVTYMFVHSGFLHLVFNMIVLYGAGVLCGRYLGTRKMGWIYFLSGIAGALMYLAVYNLFPVGRTSSGIVAGASAAVLGVLVAVAAYVPNQEMQLWFILKFNIKLKHLALLLIATDLLITLLSNAGGYIAHLGGALCGLLFVVFQNVAAQRRMKPRQKSKHAHKKKKKTQDQNAQRPLSDDEYNRRRAMEQKKVDAILDKISQSGYDHLTREEKDFLFNYKAR